MSHSKLVRDYSKYKSTLFFKITNKDEYHYDFQYVDGFNKLKGQFNGNEDSSCAPGRLYFTKPKHIFKFASYGEYLRDIYLPVDNEDFLMVKDPNGDKYGANMIILGERRSLFDVETIKYAISKGACLTKYVGYVKDWAFNHGAWNIIEYLINEDLVEKRDIVTMYNKIYRKVSFETFINMLKYYNIQPDDLNKIINKLFLCACKGNSVEIVKFLVEKSANIHHQNDRSLFFSM